MADALVLAIDIGTSAVRSAVVDSRGSVLSASRVERRDETAGSTFDVRRLWSDVVDSIVQLPSEHRAAIVALCIAGYVGSVFVDADGEPVGDGRGWADTSGAEVFAERAGDRLASMLHETGRVVAGGGAGAAFLDLRLTRPELAERIARVLTPKDFILVRLTGEAVTDRTSAAYTNLSAIEAHTWSPELLDLVGLTRSQLPEQQASTAVVGRVVPTVARQLGLSREVRVVAGATDGSVGAALVLRRQTDAIVDVAGSTDVLLRLVDHPRQAPARSIVNPYPLGGFSAGGPTGATGAAYAHWATLLGFAGLGDATGHLVDNLARIGPGAAGLVIDPSLSGSRFPHWQGDRRGSVRGQRADHGSAHFLLATAEGAAHIVRDAVDTLDPTRSATVILAGGAARSTALIRLRASVLGRSIEVCDEPDVTLLGAGLLALIGCEVDIEHFDAGLRRTTVHPDPAHAATYDALHEEWRCTLGF